MTFLSALKFVIACLIVAFPLWTTYTGIRDGIRYTQKLHQIPCHNCVYFTSELPLKCTVHPYEAGSVAALACDDFEQNRLL